MNAIKNLLRSKGNGEVHPENGQPPSIIVMDDLPKKMSVGKRKHTMKELIKTEEETGKTDFELMKHAKFTFDNSSNDTDSVSTVMQEKVFEGFGWIRGVLIRCVLCIFGATLFLRMPWIAGQGGILLGMCVIMLSTVIVVITAISMSAIATNGEVKNGGLYYLVSRSLGPEYGGAIGLIFYVANTVNASMNCVGLAESLVDILNGYGFYLFDGGINDIRFYGLVVCLFLQCIIFIGTEFENKTQMLLMVSIIMSIISHFIGILFPLTEEQILAGITGFSWNTFFSNMLPDFRSGITFISTFGVYFPAMTGIMGGANMSGDLKDASKSIPKGTMWAIILTTLTYSWSMLITAGTVVRDASGLEPPQFNNLTHHFIPPPCRLNNSCEYGLANDYQIMKIQGIWSPLIIVGILATTLSSASGCLIGAPRVFQALCADKLFPLIGFFAKGHGKTNDPFRAYFLTFFIAAGVICIGELNAIAEIITNFFLAAFAITNYACFDATLANSPGFRPGFGYYNKWLSLFGAFLCVAVMFVLSWLTSLITLILFGILFQFIKHNKSHVNWGSSTEANQYRKALNGLVKLTRQADHVKNYRPQLLVLTGNPAARQSLVDFSNCITKGNSLLLCGHVIPYSSTVAATSCIRKLSFRFTDWLHENHIKGFYRGVANSSLRVGVQTLLQAAGLGKMQPNIIMIGYKTRWLEDAKLYKDAYLEYTGVINDAFEADMSLCIFRNGNEGIDHSALIESEDDKLFLTLPDFMLSDTSSNLNDDLSRGIAPRLTRPKATTAVRRLSSPNLSSLIKSNTLPVPLSIGRIKSENPADMRNTRDLFKPINKYRSQVVAGYVDVWWLFDDGGLTLLLAYLLTDRQSFLEKCTLRFFTICNADENEFEVKTNVEKTLKKFRISYSEVIVITDKERPLYEETKKEFQEYIDQLLPDDKSEYISKELLEEKKDRTQKILCQREYLIEYSCASTFVIMTLPLASANVVSSPLYMLWLEMLTQDMPPTLFVRGNQTSVLTFYS